MDKNPTELENSCMNCRYGRWMVGIGQGFKCRHTGNSIDGKWMLILQRRHVCDLYEKKDMQP
jgi:hypothetical protein